MSYLTSSGYKQGPSPLSYALVALVGAIIGGILVLTLAPGYIATRAGIVGPQAPWLGGGTTPPVEWAGDWPAAAVAEAVGPSVVGIINQRTYYDFFRGKRTQVAGGSGVVFRQDGLYSYIATNQHVVAGAEELYVVLADGRRLETELVGEDWWTDLAVVRVEDSTLPVAALGDSDLLVPGELVIAIGNPVDMEFQRSVTVGVVSGLNRKVRYSDEREFRLIQTDAAINPGNSGGPLLNASGEVVGINNLKIATAEVEGMGFAIPINLARRVLDDLVVYGRVIRPYLGVKVADPAQARQYFDVNITEGLYVVEVVERSPADRAGIRAGDVILSVGGESVSDLPGLRQAIDRHHPGDTVQVGLMREGRPLTLRVVLGESPAAGD